MRITVPAKLDKGVYPLKLSLNGVEKTIHTSPKDSFSATRAKQPPTLDSGWDAAAPLELKSRSLVREGLVEAIATYVHEDLMPEDTWRGPDDLSGTIQALWDQDHLYLKAVVRDNELVNDQPFAHPLDGDGVELFVDTREYSKRPFVRTVFVPPTRKYDFPSLDYLTRHAIYHRVEAQRSQHGYAMLITIPWADLGDAQPKEGMRLGIEIGLNDADADFEGGKKRKSRIRWSCDTRSEANTDQYNMLILR